MASATTALAPMEELAQAGDWEGFALTFFRDGLLVPIEELDELRATELWPPIVKDAEASLGDLRALRSYVFRAENFRELRVPVMLQIGTESPRDLYVTDLLAAVLPDVREGSRCGSQLPTITPGGAMSTSGWAFLTSYEYGHEVDFAEATLSEAGIPALVKGREAGIWGPSFAGAPSQGLSLWVPEAQLAAARELLDSDEGAPPA